MIVQRIANASRVLGQSQGYIGLPLRDDTLETAAGRVECMISSWQPTPAELKALNEGGSVYLTVLGSAHPPVMLTTIDPGNNAPKEPTNG